MRLFVHIAKIAPLCTHSRNHLRHASLWLLLWRGPVVLRKKNLCTWWLCYFRWVRSPLRSSSLIGRLKRFDWVVPKAPCTLKTQDFRAFSSQRLLCWRSIQESPTSITRRQGPMAEAEGTRKTSSGETSKQADRKTLFQKLCQFRSSLEGDYPSLDTEVRLSLQLAPVHPVSDTECSVWVH